MLLWPWHRTPSTCKSFKYVLADVPPETTQQPVWNQTVDPLAHIRQEESEESVKARLGIQFLPFYSSRMAHLYLESCRMAPYRGPCADAVHKWYYNTTTGECETFIYGGCMGNANRFDSRMECMHFCIGGADRKDCREGFFFKALLMLGF